MEQVLIQFISALDLTMKKTLMEAAINSGSLTLSQIGYLETISLLETPSISDIAQRMGVTRASATVGVERLRRMGFVSKTRSSDDRRFYHVALTDSGHRMVGARERALRKLTSTITQALTDEEIALFSKILNKVTSAL